MEFIVISDTHFQEKPEELETKDPDVFLEIAMDSWIQTFNYAREKKIDIIFHAGDLLNHRNKVSYRMIHLIQRVFLSWSGPGNHLHLIRGNPIHDGEGSNYSGLIFSPIENIHVWNQPGTKLYDPDFYILPYYRKPEMESYLQEWKREHHKLDKRGKILITHFALAGAKNLSYESPVSDSLTKEDLSMFDYVFAGHMHKYQKPFRDKEFYHVGSPYRVSFAEQKDEKGFIHFKKGKVIFVPLKSPPMKDFIFGQDRIPSKIEGFVRLIIEGTKSYIRSLNVQEIKDGMFQRGVLGVKIDYRVEEEKKAPEKKRIAKEDSLNAMFEKYLNFTAEENKHLDRKKLIKIGKEQLG